MALQTSGAISLQDIGDEANSTTNSTSQVSLNDSSIRGLIDKASQASNSFSEYYGAASFDYTDSSGLVNGAVPDGGPYYTLVTSATTSTVLSAGKYNFVMVGRCGNGAGSASSIALWSITLNGTEAWSWTLGSGTGSTVFTTWQIVGDNNTQVKARHGTNTSGSTTAVGTKGSSSRITEYAARIGGAGVALSTGYENGGGGSVDFFNLSNKSLLNGIGDTVASGYGTTPHGGQIKETGNPASGTKWLTGIADTAFERADGYYFQATSAGTYYVTSFIDAGHNPFGGGGAISANGYGGSGNIYINIGNTGSAEHGRGGYGGGGGRSRQQSLYNPKAIDYSGGEPALWYLKVS